MGPVPRPRAGRARDGARVTARPRRLALAAPAGASLALLLTLLLLATPNSPQAVAHPAPLRAATEETPCPGALLPANYSGTVAIAGSALVPSVTLRYTYSVDAIVSIFGGGIVSETCGSANGTVAAAANGTFAFAIPREGNASCVPSPPVPGARCVAFQGPYIGVNVSTASTNPAGYFPEVSGNASGFRVVFYPELASVGLAPSGPTATFSTDATDAIRAEPRNAVGGPTANGTPTFDWSLTGAGWSFVNPATGPVANVTAAPGAGVGNLTVVAYLASVTGELASSPASVALSAVPTLVASAGLNRTVVDVREVLGVSANATGAAGYAYTATFDPGLGGTAEALACRSTPIPGGEVALGCTGSYAYPAAGTAQPVVLVSNGASAASWPIPAVTVHPPPAVEFLPAAPAGYAGRALDVTVAAAPGTGAAPFAEACLATDAGPLLCASTAGPSWTFAPLFSAPGTYLLHAWTIDAAGVNRSATTTAVVAPPLAVALGPASANADAGVGLALRANVAGGVLPGRFWWNATGLSAPLATGVLTVDGPLTVTFVPPAPGFVTVSLAVADGIGTLAVAAASLTVAVGPATALALAVVPPTGSGPTVGAPVAVGWRADDPAGDTVAAFSSAAVISLSLAGSGTPDPGWVNATSVGALPSPLPGWFSVPASAWASGALNVTIAARLAGPLVVNLTVAAALAAPWEAARLAVAPDLDHLRLADPVAAPAPPRAGATLWRVDDRFGNPAVGATVLVTTSTGGTSAVTDAVAFAEAGGGAAVWVNYSVPGAGAGTVSVTDLAGQLLAPPIAIAAAPGPLALFVPFVPLAAGGGAGVAVSVLVRPRRSRARPPTAEPDEEAALRRLADGRAAVVDAVARAGTASLDAIAAAWAPGPPPADLEEWVASLVTDGTLDVGFDPDGGALFRGGTEPAGAPRVTVDPAALDRALAVRAAAIAPESDGAPERVDDQDGSRPTRS